MTTYAVLVTEAAWARASDDERAAVFARHDEFAKLLADRGAEITAGAELTPSRGARTLRPTGDGTPTVTNGPYAEAVEQLGGFYLVRTDDLDGLLAACGALSATGDTSAARAAYDEAIALCTHDVVRTHPGGRRAGLGR